MEKKEIGFCYGPLCDPLDKQCEKAGWKFAKERIAQFEKERQAMLTLRFGNRILTDSIYDKLLASLHRKLVSYIAKANGFKVETNTSKRIR